VGIEEMDSLQMEIESLLVNAMQRNRMLKVETTVLDTEKPETLTVVLLIEYFMLYRFTD
jgi:hypothetical protein